MMPGMSAVAPADRSSREPAGVAESDAESEEGSRVTSLLPDEPDFSLPSGGALTANLGF